MELTALEQTAFSQPAGENRQARKDAVSFRATAEPATDDRASVTDRLTELFAAMGQLRHLPPDSTEAQEAVQRLRQFITVNCYPCTPQILAGLGRMYAADEQSRQHIDASGGDGTAAFASQAIGIYCHHCCI